jgi:hypothetical protein
VTPAIVLCWCCPLLLLICLLPQAWHLVGVNTTTWRSRLLAPNHAGKTTPLEGILIAITVGGAALQQTGPFLFQVCCPPLHGPAAAG